MSQIINPEFFKNVLQYNLEKTQKINDICAPLHQYFGIAHFCYLRVFNDGRYVLITNSQCTLDLIVCNDYFFRTEHSSKRPKDLLKGKLNKQLWPDMVKDEAIETLQANEIYNGFNIIREKESTLEGYYFATDSNSSIINDFYKNSFFILEEFIDYFHKVGRDLCDFSDATKQGVSPYLKQTYPTIENIFQGAQPWKKEIMDFRLSLSAKIHNEIEEIARINHLTPRELQCLFQLSSGKSAKEIGRALNISSRTVETHIDKIRLKTTCTTQKELVEWFNDNFGIYL